MLRSALLKASGSRLLAEHLPRLPATRRAVARFLPGERAEDALEAARELAREGLGSVLTCLGENVEDAGAAHSVVDHYLGVLEAMAALPPLEPVEAPLGPAAELSVKPTHLGLDVDPGLARDGLRRLCARASGLGLRVWIDMESSAYTDATLELHRELANDGLPVGICLQANLRRTPADLERILAYSGAVRLVKGAYREAAATALTGRSEIDDAYFRLAAELLASAGHPVFGTHDGALLGRIAIEAERIGGRPSSYEVHMLYGIAGELARSLAASGHAVRILISYGEAWFAWFMRRLAERPSNVRFLLPF